MNSLWSKLPNSYDPNWFKKFEPLFSSIKPGDICIDCGANIGSISVLMAERGARVYAFEPNPIAFKELSRSLAGQSGVVVYNKAVLDVAGQMPLYFHKNHKNNPIFHSTSSSLIVQKTNIDPMNYQEVEVVNLPKFILGLDAPVHIVKIDIEGAEYQLLKGMIETGAIYRAEHVLVETHAYKIPELQRDDATIRSLIKARGLGKRISLDWD
ncbi:MAG: FkbM family methyltransferase [Proteobacteria bacterium]|nr:FkbM family methyltransferase [Pseudomonadota bacterium]